MIPALKSITVFSLAIILLACSENNTTTKVFATATQSDEVKTITGIVKKIEFGKDGYTADVQTETEGIYVAMVSIVNLGGREKYQSCEAGDKVSFKGVPSILEGVKRLLVKEIISISPMQTKMLIGQNTFRGIQVGDLISKHTDYVQNKTLRTPEGVFQGYEIKDFDNNPAGYFLPDPKNPLLVGNITVTSTKAQTVKGIKVGDTFQDLQKVFPEIEVHGSEIEGRTNAVAGNLSYRLAMGNFNYEIDEAKIPGNTKILSITIR